LFSRAKDFARQEEDLIEEIAKLRREMPQKVVENVKGDYIQGVESDEAMLRAVEENAQKENRNVGFRSLERQDQIEASWGKGVKGLERLMKTMPETVAKKERAERAEAYVNGDGK
jgi:kinetochor protein Mis14/NSL1